MASAPGSVVAPTLEGSRPLLVEVQALVSPTGYGNPSRKASGLDPNRLSLLIAVLGRRAGIALGSHDVYANLAGGLTVVEPALDLPLALALASSSRDVTVRRARSPSARSACSASCAPVTGLERRLREAARLGFGRAIVPQPSTGSARCRSTVSRSWRWPRFATRSTAALTGRPSPRGEAVPAMLG